MATVPSLLAELVVECRAIGHGADLVALDGCADDLARARVLYDVSVLVRLIDRRIHLRSAIGFLLHGAAADAAGDTEERERWLIYVESDLERYRAKPEAERAAAAEVSA